MTRQPVKGVRYFTCPVCSTDWKSEARDCLSLSGEPCPNDDCESLVYGNIVQPHSYLTNRTEAEQ